MRQSQGQILERSPRCRWQRHRAVLSALVRLRTMTWRLPCRRLTSDWLPWNGRLTSSANDIWYQAYQRYGSGHPSCKRILIRAAVRSLLRTRPMPSGRLIEPINCQMHINCFSTCFKTAPGGAKDMLKFRQDSRQMSHRTGQAQWLPT